MFNDILVLPCSDGSKTTAVCVQNIKQAVKMSKNQCQKYSDFYHEFQIIPALPTSTDIFQPVQFHVEFNIFQKQQIRQMQPNNISNIALSVFGVVTITWLTSSAAAHK